VNGSRCSRHLSTVGLGLGFGLGFGLGLGLGLGLGYAAEGATESGPIEGTENPIALRGTTAAAAAAFGALCSYV
jgi:hypothetical protein